MTGRRESDSIEDQVKFVKAHVGKMSWGARLAALSVVGSLLGTMYGGFLMYQQIEGILGLDIDGFSQRMDLIEQKVTSVDENIYAIKSDLKGDIRRVSDVVDAVERNSKDTMRDVSNDLRAFREDLKALERNLDDKIQKALNNPLAG